MADITVKLTNACANNLPVYCCSVYKVCCTPISYTIKNICSLTYDLDSPVQVIPIPETQVNFCDCGNQVNCEGTGPIILKIEGNTAIVTVAWTLHDESCAVATGGKKDPGCCALPTISTAEDQLKFLLTTFQNRSVNYRYTYTGSGLTAVPCLVQKITMRLEGTSPVVYRGEMRISMGDTAVTADEADG